MAPKPCTVHSTCGEIGTFAAIFMRAPGSRSCDILSRMSDDQLHNEYSHWPGVKAETFIY